MQAFTVEIKNSSALKTLLGMEEKQYIRIISDTDLDSPSLPGLPLSIKSFKKWISDSEEASSFELKEAKNKWANKKKLLKKYIK
jgi:hypothetical protein